VGRRLAAAQALCGRLRVKPRDFDAECAGQQNLSAWLPQSLSWAAVCNMYLSAYNVYYVKFNNSEPQITKQPFPSTTTGLKASRPHILPQI